ncbi:hypothetical protein ZIOFF_018744 [Zingiber officinale]|uniref:Reverse transcriptase/retrotransposon-derived protein RNase H-like domain-containing protein n=1 Tax=Zingiber officinale TaxID=94328 RepID=A0A8J5H6P7_ZINOF|nr:hypothetical protein ZIOFF_018744 [Zingiber officinale]
MGTNCSARFKMLCTHLVKLQQSGSVEDYQRKFEQLAARASSLTLEQEVQIFISGLQDHIAVEVEIHHPEDLTSAMMLGVNWLHTLGPIFWDFSQMRMSFQHTGNTIYLQGSGATLTAEVPLSQQLPFQKFMKNNYDIFWKRVAVDNGKIEAVLHWPQPTTLRALHGFLGLTRYYRKFVQGYGVLASPLTSLLRRNSFEWNEAAELAFQKLRITLNSTPVLASPDFLKPFVVDCDALDIGIGAILQQEGRPIAVFNRPLAQRYKKLPAYEKELIGLAKAIRHWRAYLWGHKFLV